jgi:uncharacterized protein YgiM (DUF1202 family)
MNVRVLFVVVVGLLACPVLGHAESEKVKTNQSTKLYRRAGEQSPVILTVKAGQTVTLVAKDGRWLRVRVSGRTGWIPRSKVDLPESDDDIVRNTRRRPFVDGRGTKRGFGGEAGPDDRVGADATGDADDGKSKDAKDAKPDGKSDAKPDKADAGDKVAARKPSKSDSEDAASGDDDDDDKDPVAAKGDAAAKDSVAAKDSGDAESDGPRPMAHVAKATTIYNKPESSSGKSFTAQPNAVLYVGRTKGNWTRVSVDDGDAGWVQTADLSMAQPEPAAGPRSRKIFGLARGGMTVINQSIASTGTVRVPDNYTVASLAYTISLGGTVVFPFKSRLWLGGDLGYDFDMAAPGIKYQDKTIGFTYHNLNVRALAGYDLQRPSGMVVFARLGLHYDSFQVADVADFTKNTAKLPSQIIIAPTIGAALAVPRALRKLGIGLSVDAVVAGSSVSQTKNLEDGTGPSATAVYAGANAAYHLTPAIDIQFNYDLGYTKLSFSGMAPPTSARGHMGTSVSSGTDLSHAFSAGIAYGF